MSFHLLRRQAKRLVLSRPEFRSVYAGFAQGYRARDVPHAQGRVEALRLGEAVEVARANRDLLRRTGEWVDREAIASARLHYGVDHLASPEVLSGASDGRETTLTDLVCLMARRTPRLSYLEIGVSVGRNLWQVLHAAEGAQIVGMDMDRLYPPLAARLVPDEEAGTGDGRVAIQRFRYPARRHGIMQVVGNVLDEACWAALNGLRFNLIFSDALHAPEAILFEWNQLVSRRLLDPAGFIMMWDDLDPLPMRSAFDRICADAIERLGADPGQCWFRHMPGWLGARELPHAIGIIQARGPG